MIYLRLSRITRNNILLLDYYFTYLLTNKEWPGDL